MGIVQSYKAIQEMSKLTAHIAKHVKRRGVANVFKEMVDEDSFEGLVEELYSLLPVDLKTRVSISVFRGALSESRKKILKSKKGIKYTKAVA